MYFSNQMRVVGTCKSRGCEKIPAKSEYVPVAVAPVHAHFEEGLVEEVCSSYLWISSS